MSDLDPVRVVLTALVDNLNVFERQAEVLGALRDAEAHLTALESRNAKLEKVAEAARKLRDKSRWHQPMGEDVCIADQASLTELFLVTDALDEEGAADE